MTDTQETALYQFLENRATPFNVDDAVAYIKRIDSSHRRRLAGELASLINSQKVAFPLGPDRWVSARGCFEPARFVISPNREELVNGILIPGHRCIPFANPLVSPQKYRFYWKKRRIESMPFEGDPEDFYAYFSLFGEEYAPQYVAMDSPENETAYNSDPYEEPSVVTLQVLDMRGIYRSSGFVPGDRFVVRSLDWKEGKFSLERVGRDEWTKDELETWAEAAEAGFERSFELLGPGVSMEEQLAFAYWYGGERMRDVPAYSLEEFVYEHTDRFETVTYGIESRFWYAGKEIPDCKGLLGAGQQLGISRAEDILAEAGLPISELVIHSYVLDALYRGDPDIPALMERILPGGERVLRANAWEFLANLAAAIYLEYEPAYSPFADTAVGPVRQRMGELHTAVAELAFRLGGSGRENPWLPKQTFIVLSQLQEHSAAVMEDLCVLKNLRVRSCGASGEAEQPYPTEKDLELVDYSLDGMIEDYEQLKELISEAESTFRRNSMTVIHAGDDEEEETQWRVVQLSLGGTDVWRRVILPDTMTLEALHEVIQLLFDWEASFGYRFCQGETVLSQRARLGALLEGGSGLDYEYGGRWTIKVLGLSPYTPAEGEAAQIRCEAGAGAAPPEELQGPQRFRRLLGALNRENGPERYNALDELGEDFDPERFNLDDYNRRLAGAAGGGRG